MSWPVNSETLLSWLNLAFCLTNVIKTKHVIKTKNYKCKMQLKNFLN